MEAKIKVEMEERKNKTYDNQKVGKQDTEDLTEVQCSCGKEQ